MQRTGTPGRGTARSTNAAMHFPDGSSYEGKVSATTKLSHGFGVMVYRSGARYEGEWEDGLYHGKGIKTYKDGIKHEGRWREGKRDGQGTTTLPNGEEHGGSFRAAKFAGECRIKFSAGSRAKSRTPQCCRPPLYGQHVYGIDTIRFDADEEWADRELRRVSAESSLRNMFVDRAAMREERERIGRHYHGSCAAATATAANSARAAFAAAGAIALACALTTLLLFCLAAPPVLIDGSDGSAAQAATNVNHPNIRRRKCPPPQTASYRHHIGIIWTDRTVIGGGVPPLHAT